MLLVHQAIYIHNINPHQKVQHMALANHVIGAKRLNPPPSHSHSHTHSCTVTVCITMCSATCTYTFVHTIPPVHGLPRLPHHTRHQSCSSLAPHVLYMYIC